jgi:hypothetical protein
MTSETTRVDTASATVSRIWRAGAIMPSGDNTEFKSILSMPEMTHLTEVLNVPPLLSNSSNSGGCPKMMCNIALTLAVSMKRTRVRPLGSQALPP